MAGYFPSRNFTKGQSAAMNDVVAGKPTKSAKIRALAAAGHTRADIAAYLGIRYQHVHSVLGPASSEERRMAAGNEMDMPATTSGVAMVEDGGRVMLPPAAFAALGAPDGAMISWRAEEDCVVLMGRRSGLRWAQEIVRAYSAGDTSSWTDDLIAERRTEAAREDEEARQRG